MESTSTDPATRIYGSIQIHSQTVAGGVAINVFTASGGHRHDILSFATPDVEAARLAYAVIRAGGRQFKQPEQIREDLSTALRNELLAMQRRTDMPSRRRVDHINNLLDLVDPVSDSDVARLVDAIGGTPERARNFGDFGRLHRAAMERDKAERAARKAVA